MRAARGIMKSRHIKQIVRYIDYLSDWKEFRKMAGRTAHRFDLNWKDRMPCLGEKTGSTAFDRHYIYHVAWAAHVLFETRPAEHVDIGSSLYFSSTVSSFVKTRFYDYRPADLRIENLFSGAADLLHLPFEDNSIPSLSCMHTVEHVGLGRYGDKLDPDGDLKAMAELKRVLAWNGSLLFVVPVGGTPKLAFNSQRIYTYKQIVESFLELSLREFALIPDSAEEGGLIRNADARLADNQSYGCGCFHFIKTPMK